jgi:hypothetical protein
MARAAKAATVVNAAAPATEADVVASHIPSISVRAILSDGSHYFSRVDALKWILTDAFWKVGKDVNQRAVRGC